METTVTLFDNRTLQKVFLQEAIKDVLKARKVGIRIGNEKDCRNFFSDVVDYVVHHYSRGLYTTYENAINGFKRYGINTGLILIEAMDAKRSLLKGNGYEMDKIKDPTGASKGYKSIGRMSCIGMDTTRTLVIRSKYGNYPPMFYHYDGPVRNCPQMTKCKLDYHYATGCKYYETRPILHSNWIALPTELQNATCICDRSDMDEAHA